MEMNKEAESHPAFQELLKGLRERRRIEILATGSSGMSDDGLRFLAWQLIDRSLLEEKR